MVTDIFFRRRLGSTSCSRLSPIWSKMTRINDRPSTRSWPVLRRYGKASAAGNSAHELSNAGIARSLVSIVLLHTGTVVSHSLRLGLPLYPKLDHFHVCEFCDWPRNPASHTRPLGLYELRCQASHASKVHASGILSSWSYIIFRQFVFQDSGFDTQ
jgi:hypothetical protein